MPFEQIQIGDQQSQPMAITAIYDDFLKCEMKCVTAAGESTKIVSSKEFQRVNEIKDQLVDWKWSSGINRKFFKTKWPI